MKRILGGLILAAAALLVAPAQALADSSPCPRPASGSEVPPPPDLYSSNGVLNLALNFEVATDEAGRTLYCFVTPDGTESPTLHVNPGDTLIITLTNLVPDALAKHNLLHLGLTSNMKMEMDKNPKDVCGDSATVPSSVNIHFHGTNTSPKCHSDEVIHTLVNYGTTFRYKLRFPKDEPPGLYWYHPHVHGTSSSMVQGGATGIIEVEGIANFQPAVAGLPERYLILRDQQFVEDPRFGPGLPSTPFWDVSINYVPVNFPRYQPAVITMQQGSQEFWRVVNADANTILNLEVVYDGVPQTVQIAALDGVPTGSKDGRRQGTLVPATHILLMPSARAEFIVAAPPPGTKKAQLVTLTIDGGPASDVNPARPYANIVTTTAPVKLRKIEPRPGSPIKYRYNDLALARVDTHRDLYFSEYFQAFGFREKEAATFFITVDGAKEKLFDPNNPPAITTTQGSVEEWRIENRTEEIHAFHIHQIHFLVTAINDVPIPEEQQQAYDVFPVGYWDGDAAHAFPSITIKLDFRGPDTGDFVYHCHILDHEDLGMMAIIRVKKKGEAKRGS